MMNPCIFLDRDGVLNVERGTYTWVIEDFKIIPGVVESLKKLKEAGFLLIVVTNQSGIGRGLFTKAEMEACHRYLMEQTRHILDDIYYSTVHPSRSESLLRKPDSLMFEKAMARYNIDPAASWMVGDNERDMIPASRLGIRRIFIGLPPCSVGSMHIAEDLRQATGIILENQ